MRSGAVTPALVRDLRGVLDREDAAVGLFVTLEEPSAPMRQEAATAGAYHLDLWGRDYPRLQLLTVRELLAGQRPQLPPFVLPTYERAERVPAKKAAEQAELFG